MPREPFLKLSQRASRQFWSRGCVVPLKSGMDIGSTWVLPARSEIFRMLALWSVAVGATPFLTAATEFDIDDAQTFLQSHCNACHQGEAPPGGLRTDVLQGASSFREHPEAWVRIASRVSNHEMPPDGAPLPSVDRRQSFVEWVEATWRTEACAGDLPRTPPRFRRLNRDEYAATLRDLFDLQIDVSEMLPIDGPGGEGFDNTAETLFISPLLTEKYLETAKFVVDAASKEFKSRRRVFVARPGQGVTEQEAVRKILSTFLPRAYRRPVTTETVESYARLFRKARRQGLDFEPAVFFALRSVLVSPAFVFHVSALGEDPQLRQYALASRLSYFLWGTMPDELLLDIAAAGKMAEPGVLNRMVPRMLRDDRALEFATRFTEQWLRTRELEGPNGPDPELFPDYAASAELRGDVRLQPVFFFREIFRENRSLLDFLDSDGTILTRNLIEHLELPMKKERDGKNPNWMDLPEGVARGGLVSMPAVAALASHPHRTSPVLRGVWVLDSILGTPPPPPPPDVPELEDSTSEQEPMSMREMLAFHSSNSVCASCHDRIDPIGFALENYDVVGRWRESEAGVLFDASGELPDGTALEGPQGLKKALFERKKLFLRNLARRMLGYALGRGLTPADSCVVEEIVESVEGQDLEAWSLVRRVVTSEPFRN